MIIGLTGKNGSGKGAVAEILKARGFQYSSLSDVLRGELANLGQPVTRDALIRKGQELRAQGGAGVLAERLIQTVPVRTGNHCVDSFRHPAEVAAFRALPGFILWRVEADARVRFERTCARKRECDPTDFKSFCETEEREFNSGDPAKQDVLKTLACADTTIENNGTLAELERSVEKELKKIAAHSA